MNKTIRRIITLALLALSLNVRAQFTTTATQQPWVGAWATAVQSTTKDNLPPVATLAGHSARQIVRVTIAGETIRLKLSNAYGKSPLTITSVYIADAANTCDINVSTARYVRFAGKKSVTIAAGKQATSDPLKYSLKALQRLAITINYGSTVPKEVTSHPGSRTTTYIIKGEGRPKSNYAVGKTVDHWYTLDALEVLSPLSESVAVLGNSITDGRGSTTNMQNRWPDMMAVQLQQDGITNIGVLNLGIGGNCVLRGGLGEPAVKRFARDIMSQQGVRSIILFEGVNDIGNSNGDSEATATKLIEAYKAFTAQAHARGIRVYGATITPFGGHYYYTPFHEAARTVVNTWIKSSNELDGVIDFDALMRDPQRPSQLRADMQEDWLHPNAKGYAAMGKLAADIIKQQATKQVK